LAGRKNQTHAIDSMGAKSWMIAYVEKGTKPEEVFASQPALDREASEKLARELFPRLQLIADVDGDLSRTCPRGSRVLVGCYPGVSVVASSKLMMDAPSQLPARYLSAARGRDVYYHVMWSTVDWFAYAIWSDGKLIRSLDLSSDTKVTEDIGEHLPFEAPYWNGQRPIAPEDDSYPLPFHPLDLGETVLFNLFGYYRDGGWDEDDSRGPLFDPKSIVLAGFKGKPWWKIW